MTYSTGKPVQASDFRRGLERSVQVGNPYTAYYFTGLVGGDKCTQAHCDLSRGIVADDRARTVTYHLRAADPEFLYKVALMAAYPVPAGTPMRKALPLGVPGTGPYMIKSFAPTHVVLVRNPYFRVWSAAAQPDGYPDRIEWTYPGKSVQGAQVTKALSAQVTEVEQGKADEMIAPPPSRLNEIATRYAAQVHSLPVTETYGIFLNTRVPPFSSLQARRAVNFAIDRGKAISDSFGGTVTCQLIPPGIPGYRPYCPYTKDPTKAGVWTGPDLARARQLVRASGTYGAHVTFWTHDKPIAAVIAKVAVTALKAIGYHVTLKVLPHTEYWNHVNTPANRSQAGFIGWSQDYPAASEFFIQFTCASYSPVNGQNGDQAQVCSRSFDRRFNAALSGQVTDSPQTANANWASIDRLITNLGPWAALYNPRQLVFVSRRVQNLQSNPEWGILADQIWVH
jgi:peptide/nickel transport system substrate-binding protein